MADDLKALLEKAKSVEMTPDEKERQRRSFAYGNTRVENPLITRETVKEQAEALKESK